jgi:starvation-inducible DNA-binding protein
MKEKKSKGSAIDIGIDGADRQKIVDGLSRLLADSLHPLPDDPQLPLECDRTHFNSLHQMFMVQYTEQWNALDVIAERIRALGHPAPGTFSEFARLASIEAPEGVPAAKDMIRLLVAAQEATARTARGLFPLVDKASDQPTADLLTQRLEVHEKTAWMLRSLLEE